MSTDDIDILLEGVDIDIEATEVDVHAVRAKHEGSGDIDIDVTHSLDDSSQVVRSTIDTSGEPQAFAIYGEHRGTGIVDISVSSTNINTTGKTAHGVHSQHFGDGHILFDVSGSRIDTKEKDAHGIFAQHNNTSSEEDVDTDVSIMASSNQIVTEGKAAHGIRGTAVGSGDVTLTTTSNTVTTKGEETVGIYGYHVGDGDIAINSGQDTITTENSGDSALAFGIWGWHQLGDGDINIKVDGSSIKTKGYLSAGITGWHGATNYSPVSTQGVVDIDVNDTIIETEGTVGYGIWGIHTGSGGIRIVTRGNQRIATTGARGHGIVAYHTGTGEDRSIDITVGGSIDAQGAGAQGVRVGTVSSGNVGRAAAFDEDGYRKQTVTVNGSIGSATGAGVFLAGGGRVFIGPTGSIETDSGIAILATGDTPGDNPEDPAIKPKLFVGMELDGRRVADVIGDDWIINDGGETTIAVNGVTLHDGATGAVSGAVAPNGAWDVSIREAGVKVTDRTATDQAIWTVSEPAAGVIADRDFSTADFSETLATCPPGQVGTPPHCAALQMMFRPPEPDHVYVFPACPPGQIGVPPNCSEPPPETCPPGQVGAPPNCSEPPPETCPPGQVGAPPNCSEPPPETCPPGQIGAPPNCSEPPPETCPPGQIGAPPDCSEPPPGARPPQIGPPNCSPPRQKSGFLEMYAPRAAVYEALPGFLLRLNAPGSSRAPTSSQESVGWGRLSWESGGYEPERACVAAEYDFSRHSLEAGLDIPLGDSISGLASIRSLRGSADVSAPTGGGKIEAKGFGAALGLSVNGAHGLYARGGFSYTSYRLDLASDTRGALKAGVDAEAYFLDLEAGRRLRLDGRTFVTPRIKAMHSAIEVGDFTDAVDARVSVADASRYKGTVGLVAGMEQQPDRSGGVLVLRGSADLEQTLAGTATNVRVSGEELHSVSPRTRLRLMLGGTYRQNRLTIDAAISAAGVGSNDIQYSGEVALKMQF